MWIQRIIDARINLSIDSADKNSGLRLFKHGWSIKMTQGLLLVGDRAPEWELVDAQGALYTLAGVQAQKPAILTLLRHFG